MLPIPERGEPADLFEIQTMAGWAGVGSGRQRQTQTKTQIKAGVFSHELEHMLLEDTAHDSLRAFMETRHGLHFRCLKYFAAQNTPAPQHILGTQQPSASTDAES